VLGTPGIRANTRPACNAISSPVQAGQERQAIIKQSFINAGHLDLYATKTTNPSEVDTRTNSNNFSDS
jgi:hypothetical protein